ncbi:dihydrolipoamide acetyltransferase family protein [Herbiconiux ginsengi]|uniref:Dihydrolipoamide acetyltransferase component of pyruvate dehydrogenase complex n=1 Tax=Herbiconiux ginsengi TaxID=381665 RepID=A0A1H3MZB9_9MICO|nr:dihydrolipoamide acetyltransferase family protein [Herbiconiux ginsengi]SDY81860.1 pyruvate dehydrogenase E2 component (dihydrolipoamide acetyltransferase) [Herbiconiux ginsengi]
MPGEFLLPDLGEGLTEAEIVSWLVAPGDVIAIDQLVVEVESAKSVVELPSPYAGRVAELHGAPGDVVQKGSPLITVVPVDAEVAADAVPVPVPAPAPVRPSDAVRADVPVAVGASLTDSAPGGVDSADAGARADSVELVPGTAVRAPDARPAAPGSGAVLVGYGTKESTVRLRRPDGGRFGRRAAPQSTPATAAGALLDPARRSPVVSPIVRKRARDHGFDASQLLGSGVGNLVLRQDVEAAIAAGVVLPAVAPTDSSHIGQSSASYPDTGRVEEGAAPHTSIGAADLRIPITGLRKVVAARLAQSRRLIPEATIWLDVDATELFAAKERLQKSTGERFSLTALLARFVVAGLKQYPILNSSVDDETNEIVQHGSINLGLAAQTPRGLMVPVVHGAHDLTTRTLRDEIAAVVTRAEKGDFPPSALSGGTFTLNNYGGFGVDGSAAIINHPEVAMLGVGRVIDRPWVVDGEIVVRKVVELTLVFDHRVCDGDVASGFLTYVARCVEEPLLLLGNL